MWQAPDVARVTKFALKVAQKNFGNTAKKSDESIQPFSVRSNSPNRGWIHPPDAIKLSEKADAINR